MKIALWFAATLVTALALYAAPSYAATTLFPTGGGTGSTTLTGILIGNGISPVKTLTIGTGLSLTGTTLAATGSSASSTLLGDTNTFSGTNNTFTHTLTLTGLLDAASSTIGNGTIRGGLTISGGVTTTQPLIITNNQYPSDGLVITSAAGVPVFEAGGSTFTVPGGAISTFTGRTIVQGDFLDVQQNLLTRSGTLIGSQGGVGATTNLVSDIADGASTVVVKLNSLNTLANSGAKLFSVQNNGAEKFFVSALGTASTTGLIVSSAGGSGTRCAQFASDGTISAAGAGCAGSSASSTLLGDTNTFSGTDTFSNTIGGSINGNASTATTLQNARTINGVSFNGSANITVASTTLLGDSNTFSGTLDQFSNTLKIASLSGFIGGNSGTLYNFATSTIKTSQLTNDAGFLTSAVTAVTANYPLSSSGGNTPAITTAFGTTSTWGIANNSFIYTNNAGVPVAAASSSFFGYTPLNPTRTLTINGTANQLTSSAGSQDLSADRTWTLSLPSHVIFPGNFQATNATTTNATTTGTFYVTGPFATTTKFFANGLTSCNSASNALTYDGSGTFGCNTITSTAATFPFTPTSNFGAAANSTSTPLWLQAGLQASSTSIIGTTTFTNSGFVGIASSSPYGALSINPLAGQTAPNFVIGSSTGTLFQERTDGSVSLVVNGTANNSFDINPAVSGQSVNIATGNGSASFNWLLNPTTGGGTTLANLTSSAALIGNGNLLGGIVIDPISAAAPIIFGTGGSALTNERVRITSAGLVGIGSTTPASTLSVQGNGLFSGDLALASLTATGTIKFSGITGSTQCLHVDTNGTVTGTGSDCGSGGATFAYPFPLGATSSPLMLLASTTIGNGTVTGGLTVSGTATTSNFINTSLTSALALFDGNHKETAYGGASACASNNWVTTISAIGATTCGTIGANGLALSMFPTIGANTVLANVTGSAATPTALATSSLFTFGAGLTQSSNSIQQIEHPSFQYSTSTAWTGTTTIFLQIGYGEVFNNVRCATDVGTLNLDFYHAASHLNFLKGASTTIGTFGFTSNNTITDGDLTKVDIGTPASSPTKIICTVKNTY